MLGVTVYVGINILPGEGTAKRVSIWEGVDQSGWMVEARGGKSSSYLSLAEVEVYGIESESTYSIQDAFGIAGIDGSLVVTIDNHIEQEVCFNLIIEYTAYIICEFREWLVFSTKESKGQKSYSRLKIQFNM